MLSHQASQIAQVRCILPSRDGRLRAQVPAGIRQAAARQLERWIEPQPIEVVGVFVAAGNCEDAGAQNIGQQMGDPIRIAAVRDRPSMTPPSELIRPPSKAAVIFLRRTAGKQNGRRVSSVMAGVACLDPGKGLGTESYARSMAYATPATPNPPPS
jgi:hypothetical protein